MVNRAQHSMTGRRRGDCVRIPKSLPDVLKDFLQFAGPGEGSFEAHTTSTGILGTLSARTRISERKISWV